ncbi:hypothetical protein FXO38_06681 [Capsicum annuum]|nr:hypothetical protein FXO38_06681 [Capsicum annuum]
MPTSTVFKQNWSGLEVAKPHTPYADVHRLQVKLGDRCGIYGVNCPEWIMAMEACNSQAISYVPLYDSLGGTPYKYDIPRDLWNFPLTRWGSPQPKCAVRVGVSESDMPQGTRPTYNNIPGLANHSFGQWVV